MSHPIFACALLLAASSTAFAQTLRDPTRPPAAAAASSASGPLREGETRAPTGPVLQSVIVSGGRRLALIDGKTYTVGDKIGEAKLISISGSEVTLRESGGRKVLRLTPDARKTTIVPKAESEASPRQSDAPARVRGQK